MEADQRRADSILEGAPVGVFITEREDPSTFHFLCCGTAAPSPHPDAEPVQHYTSCPIWAAGLEIKEAERAFAPPARPEPQYAEGGATVTEEELDEEELTVIERWAEKKTSEQRKRARAAA